jgi:hypothetical protein
VCACSHSSYAHVMAIIIRLIAFSSLLIVLSHATVYGKRERVTRALDTLIKRTILVIVEMNNYTHELLQLLLLLRVHENDVIVCSAWKFQQNYEIV